MTATATPSMERLETLREQLDQHLSQEFPHLSVDVTIEAPDTVHVEAMPR